MGSTAAERRYPACASARRTYDQLRGSVKPIRAPIRVKRPVANALTTTVFAKLYRARASPTSENSGKWSTIRPLPRTDFSSRQECRQVRARRLHPAQTESSPQSKIAWSRRPLRVRSRCLSIVLLAGREKRGRHGLAIFEQWNGIREVPRGFWPIERGTEKTNGVSQNNSRATRWTDRWCAKQ